MERRKNEEKMRKMPNQRVFVARSVGRKELEAFEKTKKKKN